MSISIKNSDTFVKEFHGNRHRQGAILTNLHFSTTLFYHCAQIIIITLKISILLQLLLLLVSVYRYETEVTEPKLVETEAEILHKCIKDKAYNHDEIVRILTTRSKAHLTATFYRFRDVYSTPITKVN